MGLVIGDNFEFKGHKPLDARIVFNTISDMVGTPPSTIYDGIIVYVIETNKYYNYIFSRTASPTMDKWDEFRTAGTTIQSIDIDDTVGSPTQDHMIITFTDGTTQDAGYCKGNKGDVGAGFAISKLYSSASDMVADVSPIDDGKMAGVVESTVQPDGSVINTAIIYIRNATQTAGGQNLTGYTFFCNLGDAVYIKGAQGEKGAKGDTPQITFVNVAATATTPAGVKVVFTTGTGATMVSQNFTLFNGKDALSIQSAGFDANENLVLTMSDGTTQINAGQVPKLKSIYVLLGCYDSLNPAPTTFSQGDMYYNKDTGKIHTATSNNVWNAGDMPLENVLYLDVAKHTLYSYIGGVWGSYGGGDTTISGAVIMDTLTSPNYAWSSQKIVTYIDEMILGGAS